MPAIEPCGQEIREWRPCFACLWLGAQVVDCLQGKAVLICNSFRGWGGGCSGFSKLERSLNDIIKAIAFRSQIVMEKTAHLGFLL